MTPLDPLPIRFRTASDDVIGLEGIKTTTTQLEGLLHFDGDVLTIEWTGTEKIERLGFAGIRTDVDELPIDWIEVPIDWITEARFRGGWWAPRIELRARHLDAFDGVPRARPGVITLRVLHRHRAHAREFATEIDIARLDRALEIDSDYAELEEEDTYPQLDE